MVENMEPEHFEFSSLDIDKFKKDLERLQSGSVTDKNEQKQIAEAIMSAVKKGFYDWDEVGMTEEEVSKLLE